MKKSVLARAALILGLSVGPALADAPPAAGPNFQLSQGSQGSQLNPDLAQDGAGSFVAVWIDGAATPTTVRARLFKIGRAHV